MAFFFAKPHWQNTLAQYPPDIVLVPTNSLIATQLATLPNWRLLYQDPAFTLFGSPAVPLPPNGVVPLPTTASFP